MICFGIMLITDTHIHSQRKSEGERDQPLKVWFLDLVVLKPVTPSNSPFTIFDSKIIPSLPYIIKRKQGKKLYYYVFKIGINKISLFLLSNSIV